MGVNFRPVSYLAHFFSLVKCLIFPTGKFHATANNLGKVSIILGTLCNGHAFSANLSSSVNQSSASHSYLTLLSSSEIKAQAADQKKQSLIGIDDVHDCRFFVDGLGKVRTKILDGRYSILAMRVELVVNVPRANVLRVGQWSRWVDGRITETSSLAYPPRLSEEHGFDPQSGRYIIQTPFSWGQQLCPGCVNNDEFSGQISELSWWIDFINENGDEERIWYSDYGRNFHIDEQFSWPTYAAGTTDKIILWLDHNAPIFSARQECEP